MSGIYANGEELTIKELGIRESSFKLIKYAGSDNFYLGVYSNGTQWCWAFRDEESAQYRRYAVFGQFLLTAAHFTSKNVCSRILNKYAKDCGFEVVMNGE